MFVVFQQHESGRRRAVRIEPSGESLLLISGPRGEVIDEANSTIASERAAQLIGFVRDAYDSLPPQSSGPMMFGVGEGSGAPDMRGTTAEDASPAIQRAHDAIKALIDELGKQLAGGRSADDLDPELAFSASEKESAFESPPDVRLLEIAYWGVALTALHLLLGNVVMMSLFDALGGQVGGVLGGLALTLVLVALLYVVGGIVIARTTKMDAAKTARWAGLGAAITMALVNFVMDGEFGYAFVLIFVLPPLTQFGASVGEYFFSRSS